MMGLPWPVAYYLWPLLPGPVRVRFIERGLIGTWLLERAPWRLPNGIARAVWPILPESLRVWYAQRSYKYGPLLCPACARWFWDFWIYDAHIETCDSPEAPAMRAALNEMFGREDHRQMLAARDDPSVLREMELGRATGRVSERVPPVNPVLRSEFDGD